MARRKEQFLGAVVYKNRGIVYNLFKYWNSMFGCRVISTLLSKQSVDQYRKRTMFVCLILFFI